MHRLSVIKFLPLIVMCNAVFIRAQNATHSFGRRSCPAGELICNDVTLGATCYNPSIYSCPVGSAGPVLCGNEEHGPDEACGIVCYDPVVYICCNGTTLYNIQDPSAPCSVPTTAAPTTSAPTTSAPTTSAPTTSAPTTQSPVTCGSATCLVGQSCCDDVTLGPTCYDPANYTCPIGSPGPVLCGNQQHGPDQACGTVCYDPVEYVCCGTSLYPIQYPAIPCSVPTTAAPTTAAPTTSAPTTYPSPVTCGSATCLNGQSCCDDVTLGPICYDPSIYTCTNGSTGPVLCGNQQNGPDKPCGTVCYDPEEYVCCNDQLFNVQTAPANCGSCDSLSCMAGEQCCDDVTLGPTCYNPSIYSCPMGTPGPVLCGFEEQHADLACGTACYDPTEYICCGTQLYSIGDQSAPCR